MKFRDLYLFLFESNSSLTDDEILNLLRTGKLPDTRETIKIQTETRSVDDMLKRAKYAKEEAANFRKKFNAIEMYDQEKLQRENKRTARRAFNAINTLKRDIENSRGGKKKSLLNELENAKKRFLAAGGESSMKMEVRPFLNFENLPTGYSEMKGYDSLMFKNFCERSIEFCEKSAEAWQRMAVIQKLSNNRGFVRQTGSSLYFFVPGHSVFRVADHSIGGRGSDSQKNDINLPPDYSWILYK